MNLEFTEHIRYSKNLGEEDSEDLELRYKLHFPLTIEEVTKAKWFVVSSQKNRRYTLFFSGIDTSKLVRALDRIRYKLEETDENFIPFLVVKWVRAIGEVAMFENAENLIKKFYGAYEWWKARMASRSPAGNSC